MPGTNGLPRTSLMPLFCRGACRQYRKCCVTLAVERFRSPRAAVGKAHKNKTGFDFARLFTGSEGMLAVVTEATLKLLPLPPYRASLAVGFDSMRNGAAAIRAIFAAGFLPAAMEIADAFTLAAAY